MRSQGTKQIVSKAESWSISPTVLNCHECLFLGVSQGVLNTTAFPDFAQVERHGYLRKDDTKTVHVASIVSQSASAGCEYSQNLLQYLKNPTPQPKAFVQYPSRLISAPNQPCLLGISCNYYLIYQSSNCHYTSSQVLCKFDSCKSMKYEFVKKNVSMRTNLSISKSFYESRSIETHRMRCASESVRGTEQLTIETYSSSLLQKSH